MQRTLPVFIVLISVLVVLVRGSSLIELSAQERSELVQSILSNNLGKQSNNLQVLGFVTPWNGLGYDVAKSNEKHVKLISPVWLQIRPNQKNPPVFEITGVHDVDMGWMKEVKSKNIGAKLMPRIQFDYAHWTQQQIKYFYGQKSFNKNLHQPIVERIAQLVRAYDLDGVVLEVGFIPFDQIKHIIVPLLQKLREKFNTLKSGSSLEIHLVVPSLVPPSGSDDKASGLFLAENLKSAYPFVNGFLVMTYDYFSHMRSKNAKVNYVFNAPLSGFVDLTYDYFVGTHPELADKLFLGLNFYGTEVVAQNIKKGRYLSDKLKQGSNEDTELFISNWLGNNKKIDFIIGGKFKELLTSESSVLSSVMWDSTIQEHIFEFVEGDNVRLVFYPTPQSIKARVDFAKSRNLGGIMIWELGQGLDSFYRALE